MKVDESNFETLDEVQKITGTDYDIKWSDSQNIEGFVFCDQLFSMIEDLICEIHTRDETIEDLKEDMRDNFTRNSVSSQCGVSDRDFI